jgi:hypothetical protein
VDCKKEISSGISQGISLVAGANSCNGQLADVGIEYFN